MSESAHRLDHSPPLTGGLAALAARPQWVAAVCIVALAALGWLALALVAAAEQGAGFLPRALIALCRVAPASGAEAAALTLSMWAAMVLAMMLPSAAPMILAYAEIADTAAKKGERIVSPLAIAAGYAAVWLGFAAVAAALQIALARFAWLDAGLRAASGLFAGALFVFAGAYQFTALKHACLTQCQRPFPFFFAHWQTSARGVFGLGLKQGLYCLGCCWAMMLLMFALGAMNLVWMAALAMIMTIEKMFAGRAFTFALGGVLIAAGVAILGIAFAGHWPAAAN